MIVAIRQMAGKRLTSQQNGIVGKDLRLAGKPANQTDRVIRRHGMLDLDAIFGEADKQTPAGKVEPAAASLAAAKVEQAPESDGRERDEWGFPLAAGERAAEWC
jgi:hypothetical protein